MRGLTITRRAELTLSLTADQWELYNVPGCNDAAIVINNAVEAAVNAGKTQHECEQAILPVFRQYADQGAMDSEPLAMLDNILRIVFK